MGTRKIKVLVLGKVWPEPESSAAGVRMQQLINLFLDHGFEVFFGSTAGKTEFSLSAEQLGVKEVGVRLNDSSFDETLATLNPAIVLFDRFTTEEQFGW